MTEHIFLASVAIIIALATCFLGVFIFGWMYPEALRDTTLSRSSNIGFLLIETISWFFMFTIAVFLLYRLV